MARRLMLFTFALLLALSACAPAAEAPAAPGDPPAHDTPAAVEPAPLTPASTPTSSPTDASPHPPVDEAPPEPDPEPAPPTRSRYTMQITLDYAARSASVQQIIDYANNTGETLNDLVLKVDTVNVPSVFRMERLAWGDGSAVAGSEWDGATLRIPLPEPLPPGEVRSLAVDYQLSLPRMVEDENLRPPIFGYTERQTNLVDWYPFVPPRTDEGWMVHPRGHYGEHLTYETADYAVDLRLENAPANLVVAASAPGERDGDWTRYRLPAARNFVFSLSPDYEVLEAQAGDVTVYSYVFPVFRTAGAAVLQTTVDALLLWQELFGPYPHATLSAVQADFMDGMEYDGLYFLSRAFYNIYSGAPSDYLIAIAAHETAHQWWYALIGNNQALEPWLDEALCTYMEHIYYERYAPEALNWWWSYRVNYYEPRGLIDVSIYDQHGQFQSYRAYRDAVYLNGAVFLHELRTTIGDDAFFAFLADYAARHAGGIATRESFFATLAEHTDQDLSALTAKYFR